MASLGRSNLQHRVWRWHFFAGLMIIPFAVILAVTGAIYLFKPQVEASIEASINVRAVSIDKDVDRLSSNEIVDRTLEPYPYNIFRNLTLPRDPSDRTMEIEIRTSKGDRILWVDQYTGDILHDVSKPSRLMNFVKNIHGNLMAGNNGSYLVELMASWMIILIVTGVYLWWPRNKPISSMFIPNLSAGSKRDLLMNLHGVAGAWIGGMIFILLLSGLPWTQVWGEGFERVSKVFGWDGPGQEWNVTLQSSDPAAQATSDGLSLWEKGSGDEGVVSLTSSPAPAQAAPVSLEEIVQIIQPQNLVYPVQIYPPRGSNGVWTVRSMPQHRPSRQTVHFDQWTADEIMRIKFSDRHPVQQVASYGIALHEGALFGWFNQFLGLVAALGVIALSVTGGWMWWRRRPSGRMGVPPMPPNKTMATSVIAIICGLAIFLPLVGLSLIIAFVADLVWTKVQRQRSG